MLARAVGSGKLTAKIAMFLLPAVLQIALLAVQDRAADRFVLPADSPYSAASLSARRARGTSPVTTDTRSPQRSSG